MSGRIITLFGEEIVPEQLKAVGRSRAKKRPEDKKKGAGEPEVVNTGAISASENIAEQKETEEIRQAVVNTEEINKEESKGSVNATEEKSGIITEAPIVEETKEFELPEDWTGDKHYYSIGEVAALFKVKTSHIRFWTKEFKLKVRTTRKGDRLYTAEQVRELRAINHLVKERRFTLTGAKAKLKTQNNRDVETIDLKQSLLQLRNKLVIIRNKTLKP